MSAEKPSSRAWAVMVAGSGSVDLATSETADQDQTEASLREIYGILGVTWTADHLDGAAAFFVGLVALTESTGLGPIEAAGRLGLYLVRNADALTVGGGE